MRGLRWLLCGVVTLLLAGPALADVKAGTDAWNRGDYATAVKEWRQPAINGNAEAQFNMGQAYKLGRGVPADPKQAGDWFLKAAQQGNIQAEDNYGIILFQYGDRQKAYPYLQKSAARGEPRAQYLVGTALFNGDFGQKDWPRAYALMTRAAAAGLTSATTSLAQMDKYIPLDQRQQGLALARKMENPGATRVAEPAPAAKPTRSVNPLPSLAPAIAKAAPGSGGSWRVQLGALDSEALAKAQWTALKSRIGALSGLQPSYEKAGPFTRLRAGPIGSKAAAISVCAKAKAAGQACFPVAP
nr:SPOR domain-containing protein [Aquisediminimonas profunda]